MQTRTVRHDTVLGPGQRLDLEVFCVEAHRWEGEKSFSAAKAKVPQSIQGQLRRGESQSEVWRGVGGNNSSLGAENATGSLERAMKSPAVERKLDAVRKRIVPEIPRGTVGFIFVHGGRAVGAEFFGSEDLARAELPHLLDSYAVDYVILGGSDPPHQRQPGRHRVLRTHLPGRQPAGENGGLRGRNPHAGRWTAGRRRQSRFHARPLRRAGRSQGRASSKSAGGDLAACGGQSVGLSAARDPSIC